MRRAFVSFVLLCALSLAALPASAQDASPPAASPAAGTSLLAGLGFPDLVFTTDGTDFEAPTDVVAGRYHVIFNNLGTAAPANFTVLRPPDGMSVDELIAAFEAPDEDDNPDTEPPIFYQVIFAGGVSAEPGSTGDAIIDIPPGDWVFGMTVENEDGPTTDIAVPVTVTGEMPELVDPPADVEVTAADLAFQMPDQIPAGPHIWKFTNTGAIPHLLALTQYPEVITQEQLQTVLDAIFLGTPAATPEAMLDPDAFQDLGEAHVLSTGQTEWVEFDLEPGQYEAFCFISGPGDLPIHAAMGMANLFEAV